MFIIPKGTTITINGKVYRTLEAQVAWNTEMLQGLDVETLEGLPDSFEELSQSVSGLNEQINDPDNGIDAKVTDLDEQINDPDTGLDAKLEDIDEQINDPDTGLDARVTALENNPGQTYTAGAGIDITAGAISFDPNVVDIGTISLTDGHSSTPFSHSDFNAVNPSTMIRAYINGRYVQARMTGYYQNPDEDPNTYLFCGVNGAYAYIFTMHGITDIIEVQEYSLVELPTHSSAQNGKVLSVDSNGELFWDTPSAGTQLYNHNIFLPNSLSSSNAMYGFFNIINSRSTPYDRASLLQFMEDNQIDSNKPLVIDNFDYSNGSHYMAKFYLSGNPSFPFTFYALPTGGSNTINLTDAKIIDTVIPC